MIDKCSYSCYTIHVATNVILFQLKFTNDGGFCMSNTKQTITDSEYQIMKILWQSQNKMTVADVVRALAGTEWTPSTVSTFLQRLLKKGVVSCDKKGKSNGTADTPSA